MDASKNTTFTGYIHDNIVYLECNGHTLAIAAGCTLAIGHFIVGRMKETAGVGMNRAESEFNPRKLEDEARVQAQVLHLEKKMNRKVV